MKTTFLQMTKIFMLLTALVVHNASSQVYKPIQVYSSCSFNPITMVYTGSVWVLDSSKTATYRWSDGSTSNMIVPAANGYYSVTVYDTKGIDTGSAYVSCGNSLLSVSATSGCYTDTLISSGYLGEVFVTASGGFPPYTYRWSDGSTNQSVYSLPNAIYSVTVTDSKGNSGISSVQVNCVISPIAVTASSQCFQDSSLGYVGYGYAAASGGIAPYTYKWSDGSVNETDYPLSNANYTVTATDSKGQTATATVLVNCITPALSDSSYTYCVQDSNLVNGTIGYGYTYPTGGYAPYTYLWSNGCKTYFNGPLVNGNYTVTITDAKGSMITSSITVDCVIPPLTVTPYTNCYNDSNSGSGWTGYAYAYGAGGYYPYTYLWSDGTKNYYDGPLVNGTYTVTVTDVRGNTAASTVTVYCVTPPLSDSTYSYCYQDTNSAGTVGYAYTYPAGGYPPYTYKWSDGSTSSFDGPLANGSYTLTISDSKGNSVTSDVTVYCVTPPLSAYASYQCLNDTSQGNEGYANAYASGGFYPYSYRWSNGATSSNDYPLVNGNYTVTITDAHNATATSSVTVSCITPPLYIYAYSNCLQDSSVGYAGELSVYASGGYYPYSYNWSNGNTNSYVWPVANGIYTVTVMDGHGDMATSNVTVYCVTPPLSDSTYSFCYQDSSFNGTEGYAYTQGTGGYPPYTYRWSDGSVSQKIGPLANGSYTVTVTDSKSNNAISVVTIYCVTPPLSVSIASQCLQDSSKGIAGYAYANVSGGYYPYTYNWSDGSRNSNDGPLANGTYTLTVTDSKGNTAEASVSINCTCAPPSVSYVCSPSGVPHWYDLWTYYSPNTVSVTWYWGDGTSSSGFWVSHTYPTGAFYNICVTVFNACGDSANFCLLDSIFRMQNLSFTHVNISNPNLSTAGIGQQPEQDFHLNIFPNPARDHVNVSYSLAGSTAVDIELYDVLGNEVMKIENDFKTSGDYQTQVNVAGLSSGIYLLKLGTENQVSTKRILISK